MLAELKHPNKTLESNPGKIFQTVEKQYKNMKQ